MNIQKRLKYEKYRGIDNIITINLHNDYTVIAIIGKNEDNIYDVQLMLKENTVSKWDVIEDAEHLEFNATYKTIHAAILKKVSELLEEGFFDYYKDRYEYELLRFDYYTEDQDDQYKLYCDACAEWDDLK